MRERRKRGGNVQNERSVDMAEIVYSDEYEDYICSACGELMPLTVFRFCPYCGRPFKQREVRKA